MSSATVGGEHVAMTPTEIDRELGSIFRRMLDGSASEKDMARQRTLMDMRSSMIVRLPVRRATSPVRVGGIAARVA